MNNLLSQLLIKLAQKEADEKRLQTRVAALEALMTAVISALDDHNLIKLKQEIDLLLARETPVADNYEDIRVLLHDIRGMASVHPQE